MASCSHTINMDDNKRQAEYKLITALLLDIQKSHVEVFNTKSLRLTLKKVQRRFLSEGIGFLTKTLPRLGKALDRALSNEDPFSATKYGFKPMPGSELPLFCGEFFKRIFNPDGTVLPDPCADSVGVIRQITYLFYKYELPYTDEQEQKVVAQFERTELDILARSITAGDLHSSTDCCSQTWRSRRSTAPTQVMVAREARNCIQNALSTFDFTDIVPSHGPGAVATRQQLWGKYDWTNVSNRLTTVYPLDAYFFASLGHVCDRLDLFEKIKTEDLSARVVLVPKDSRGPRLISCEPVDYQWIQQGVMRGLVSHLEHNPITRFNVFFTDQGPNQRGALLGSSSGRYATLDLNEASDRVSLDLVRLLFPPEAFAFLEACRSSSTVLPDGRVIRLNKFAPMGSSLCFPILALTVWAILTAAAPDAYTRERILVYGDDVIVPTAFAANAIEQLESFGLKINRDKSCTKGSFRESCGMDAFKGINVTPMRLRTVWSSVPSPEVYTSFISYANEAFRRKHFHLYDCIVGMLYRSYGEIPSMDMHLACPSLIEVPEFMLPKRRRQNKSLQKLEYYVRDIKAKSVVHDMDGWSMLLRFFTKGEGDHNKDPLDILEYQKVPRNDPKWWSDSSWESNKTPFSVRSYTKRRASMLVRRWR